MSINIFPVILDSKEELTEIFKDLHANPEIGFEEERTSKIVAEKLKGFGVDEVHTGIAKTGVVGIIRGKGKDKVHWPSSRYGCVANTGNGADRFNGKKTGVMHACGHDDTLSMLLGAAKHLAETREFDGTAVLIFQPAEEGLGGARGMLEEGLFNQFPCDEVFGMHNSPNGKINSVDICKGAAMAGASFFDITVTGVGSHAAMPQQSKDSLVIASALVGQIQSIVSRNVPPLETCVISVTQIHAGAAYNVVPETAHLAGTIRYFSDSVYEMVEKRMKDICEGFGKAYGVSIEIDLRNIFDVLTNDNDLSDEYMKAAADIVGTENINDKAEPATGSEDFADMLKVVPGAYCRVGHGGTIPLHNPSFVLDPEVLPIGASIMARIVERRIPLNE